MRTKKNLIEVPILKIIITVFSKRRPNIEKLTKNRLNSIKFSIEKHIEIEKLNESFF